MSSVFISADAENNSEGSSGRVQSGVQPCFSYKIPGRGSPSMEDGRAVGCHMLDGAGPLSYTRGFNRHWNREVSLGHSGEEVSGPSAVDRSRKLFVAEAA